MSEEIRQEELQESSQKMTKEERDELLIKWGYYNKEYSDDDSGTDEYPYCEYTGLTIRWFKKVPYDVDDEEFERIVREVSTKDKEKAEEEKANRDESTIAIIFKIIGCVVFVAGFILGIVLGKDRWGDFSFPLALAYWAGGFISGMFMFAISKIIELLQRIANNTEKTGDKSDS